MGYLRCEGTARQKQEIEDQTPGTRREAQASRQNREDGQSEEAVEGEQTQGVEDGNTVEDGDRNTVESNFAAKEFKNFVSNNSPLKKSFFDNGWEELGPHYIEEVTGHYAVGLGRIESFYIDPNNENVAFVSLDFI